MEDDIKLTESDNLLNGRTILGTGLAGSALYTAKQAIPQQFPRHLANHAYNFLEGFYAPGANKLGLYGQEFAKSLGRLGLTALNPREAISYANTGVSSLVKENIDNLRNDLKLVDSKYLAGDFGESGPTAIKKAKQMKSKLVKERHYKVLNDAANREIFGGEISKPLNDYRTRKPHLKNWWDASSRKQFIELAGRGNVDRAEYIMSRHSIGKGELPGVGKYFKPEQLSLTTNPKNVGYIKWFDNSISGVLRGAQFNYKTYELLDALKRNRMSQGNALSAIKSAGYTPRLINGKILFTFSPSIKSNFDWGGYNAVAEWDYKKPGKVRFIGTDLRDTPISSAFKGKHVLNYVESKEVNIKSIKNLTDMDTKPQKSPVSTPKAPKTDWSPEKLLTREESLKAGELRVGGQYKTMINDLDDISAKKGRSYTGVTLKNASKKLSKNMLKYAKYGGKAGTALGLAALAWNTFSGDD